MNPTNKPPCCSNCNTNYQIGDAYGPKNPMLLVCGHDMCRNCIKHLYKKNKQVICKVCQYDCMIKCDDEISNIPIHYFIVGKVWYSSYNRQRKIHQDISNIMMSKLPSKPLIKTKENCQNCQKYAAFFCEQCNEVYCADCSQEIHMKNFIMSQHDLNKLDTTHLKLLQASKCDLHLKENDFICLTCEIELCTVCAVENHQLHEVHQLEIYNKSQAQRLNEYSLKGDILLKRLKHYRDKFNVKVQKHRCPNFKKNNNSEKNKQHISTYVTSLTGALQCLEQRLFWIIDQAEQSSTNSMTNVVGQLSSFIDDLQSKLNILDVLLKNNKYSSIAMVDHIAGIERMLDTTYYLAKKNKAKSSILFDQDILPAIQRSVFFDIDTSDRYVLGCSPDLLPEYTLSATIGLNSDDNNALSERRPSSVSSMLSSSMSVSSNYSAVSGEAVATFGDVSASSADPATSSPDAAASSADAAVSSADAAASSSDAAASSGDVAASSYDDNTSGGSAAASVIDGPPQSQVFKEIVKNEVELVVVSHLNSPSDFYVQLNANLEVFNMVDSELDRHVKSKHGAVPVGHVEIDNTIMYTVQTSANKWCRGVVLQTINKNNTDLFRVHFIDYGFMETLTADRIRSAPVSVVSIPPLAYNCAIYDLKPKYTTGWSNEAFILFNDLMLAKTGSYFIYPLETKNLRIEVDVVWNGDIYPLSIRDAMFFLGYGSYEYYVNKQLHEQLVNMITLPDNLKLEEEKRYSVILCHFISPTEFYLRIGDDTAQLEEVMNTLKTIYTPTAENIHKNYLLYTPQIGMAIAARYSIDGHWYRAKIISLPEERLVTVFYIDFGNSETLPWDELRVLDKNLIKTPPLVIKASLADVIPAEDGIESTKWSDKACAAFINFSKIVYTDDNLIAFIHKVDGDTHKIVLYNRSSRAEICLNSKLVSQGYATTMDPLSCVFKKTNTRKPVKQPVLLNSRNKEVVLPCDDTLSFTKLRSATENENHSWKNKKNKFPGIPMSIVKVVSPDEIILKKMNHNTQILTDKMNKVYGDKKKNKAIICWKINDLCAIFIKKYGNWYRGKIMNINLIKKMVTVYCYDLNETIDEIPIKTLHVLEEECSKVKCEILHCGLNNLVPLGASDGIWPKFSCDRLIEELKKYPTVYFSNQSKENDIALGEIWVRVIKIPQALEPIREHWTSINRFMIEQGFALSKRKVKMDAEYSTSSQSESEFNCPSISEENDKFVNSWMPPNRLVKPRFDAIVTNVNLEGHVYFQILDDETSQSIQIVTDELNYIFSNSQPEPINVKWSQGQAVIVKYHLDKKWYRGTILKIDKKAEEFTVEFYDYGNIEIVKHEDLRSTLYTTEVPQLCHRGFFSAILPMTKNGKWPISSLDKIHAVIVEKTCQITIDENLSTDDLCAIKFLRRVVDDLDVFQFLMTKKEAYYEYVSSSIVNLVDTDKINNGDAAEDSKCDAVNDNICFATYDNGLDDCTTYHGGICGVSIHDSGGLTYGERRQTYDDGGGQTDDGCGQTYDDGGGKTDDGDGQAYDDCGGKTDADDDEQTYDDDYGQTYDDCGGKTDDDGQTYDNGVVAANAVDEERATISVGAPDASAVILDEDDGEESGYSKFCLELNEVVEGTMCRITGPTSLTLVITKIGGVDLSVEKNNMHKAMSDKCSTLPPLNHIIPGTAVIVNHNMLWRRGVVEDGGNSVFLVDFGISIKLVKKNLRQCIAEFFNLPMFTIDCRLENVRPSDDADAKDVVNKLSKTLRGVSLKVFAISKSDDGDDIVGVELYNSKEEIAYQSLIDDNLLIPE